MELRFDHIIHYVDNLKKQNITKFGTYNRLSYINEKLHRIDRCRR